MSGAAVPVASRGIGAAGFAVPWLMLGAIGAVLLLLALVGTLKQRRIEAPAVAPAPASVPPDFGGSAPGERFIQAFQQRVTEELQAKLDAAHHDQLRQLQQFEERSREQAATQLEAFRRVVDEARAGPLHDARGADGSAVDVEAPRVHVRAGARRDRPPGTDDGEGGTFPLPPDEVRAAEAPAATGRLTVGLAVRGAPHPGDPDIAPHGFAEGRLLNGVVAVVGGPERESLVALSGSYQAANGFQSDLDGCFALVQGKPEPAAGRIDFKVSRLTCNFPDGASKTWDVSGWLVDRDGIRGIRGTIVQNLDKKAAVAAIGGAVGGIGRRLSQQQYQVGTSPAGTTSSFAGSPGADAAGGAAESAANAIQQSVGEYYQLFAPSLQVGGGTAVTVVIANELGVPDSGRANTSTHAAGP